MGGDHLESAYYVLEIIALVVAGLYTGVSGIVKTTLFVQKLWARRKGVNGEPKRSDLDDDAFIGHARDVQTAALRDLEKAFLQHEKSDSDRFGGVNANLDHHAEILGEIQENLQLIRDSISRIEGHLGIWPGKGPNPANRRRSDAG
jgi:hypothetical protein